MRLILLILGGGLLILGTYLWVHHGDNADQDSNIMAGNQRLDRKPAARSAPLASLDPKKVVEKIGQPKQTIVNALPSPQTAQPNTSEPSAIPRIDSSTDAAMRTIRPAIDPREAAMQARMSTGRPNPFAPLTNFKPFPKSSLVAELGRADSHKSDGANIPESLVPPPPEGNFPPAPPAILPQGALASGDGLPVSDLPMPPARPSLAKDLKLVGMIGDKAILSATDRATREANRLPQAICLGPGQKFRDISLVAINNDEVVLEEGGQQTIKVLDPIR
ncbi:MAG TPA: hypothetical protein V6D17_18745 [Candidatus Obscuribacterales bacterium]